jgi:hypothetical protein
MDKANIIEAPYDLVWYLDIESGELVQIYRWQRDAIRNAWIACEPKLEGIKGTVFMCGTAGNGSDCGNMEDLFFNPENYSLIPFEDNKDFGKFIPAHKTKEDMIIDNFGKERKEHRANTESYMQEMEANPLLKGAVGSFPAAKGKDLERTLLVDHFGNPKILGVSEIIYKMLTSYLVDGNKIENKDTKMYIEGTTLYIYNKEFHLKHKVVVA